MNRKFKFRVLDTKLDRLVTPEDGLFFAPDFQTFVSRGEEGTSVFSDCLDRFVFQQFTGLVDEGGKDIFEGDICFAYDTRWNVLSEEKMGDVIEYTLNPQNPVITVDVPLARGKVAWDHLFLRWDLVLDWVCDNWKGKTRIELGLEYALDVINEEQI